MRRKPPEISGGLGQDELLVQPLEPADPQARFQRLHLLPHGGRRHMQLMRGKLEAEMPRRGLERAERIERGKDVGHRRPVCHR